MQERFHTKNRNNKNIVVLVEKSLNQKWLVFIAHGLWGFKDQPHIITFSEAFKEKDFTVVRFDMTNALWESDGKYEDATLTNYLHDLEDVVEWASKQDWYQEPFALCGHSLGAISAGIYAEDYPEKVRMIAFISSLVSGKLSMSSYERLRAEEFATWQETGWRVEESRSKPWVIKRLPWSHMLDRLNYDLLPKACKLVMPALVIVGENDTSTPPSDAKILFDALLWEKAFHVIKGAEHSFRKPEYLSEIKGILISWIDKI